MLKLRYSKQFKKDFKLSQKRGLPMQKLKTILKKLVNGIPLEEGLKKTIAYFEQVCMT